MIADIAKLFCKKMVFIYALETDGLIWYIGSSKNPKIRLTHHKNSKTGGGGLISSEYRWNMVILEECDDSIRKQREQHYYDKLLPFYNKIRPYEWAKPDVYWTEARLKAKQRHIDDMCKRAINGIIDIIEDS